MSSNVTIVAEVRQFLICDSCKTVVGPFGGPTEAGFYMVRRGWIANPDQGTHQCQQCQYKTQWLLQLQADRDSAGNTR